jgi:hypothetical protein
VLRAAQQGGGADLAKLRTLKEKLDPAQFNEVAATIVRQLGRSAPSATGEVGFSPGRFNTGWNQLSAEAKDILFGTGEARQQLDNVAKISRRQAAVEAAGNPSGTARTILTAGGLGGIGSGALEPLSTLGGTAATLGAGRLLVSPAVARVVSQLPSAADTARLGLAGTAGWTDAERRQALAELLQRGY